jgi:hypothetical protein
MERRKIGLLGTTHLMDDFRGVELTDFILLILILLPIIVYFGRRGRPIGPYAGLSSGTTQLGSDHT